MQALSTEIGRMAEEARAARRALVRRQEREGIREAALAALKDRGARLIEITDQLPLISYAWDLGDDTRIPGYVGGRVEEMLGIEVSRWLTEPGLFLSLLHPDDLPRVLTEFRTFFETGLPFDTEYRLTRPDGAIVWLEDRAVLVRDAAGRPLFQQGIAQDVTLRRRSEAILSVHAETLGKVVEGLPLSSVLTTLTRGIERLETGMHCSILLLDADGKRLLHGAAPSLPDEYNRIVHGLEIGPEVGCCGSAAFHARRVVVTEILTDPRWARFRFAAERFGLHSCWSEPIFSTASQVLGTFAMYYRTARTPTEAQIRIIENAARLAGVVIEADRTKSALADSEERMRLAMESAGMGTWTYDLDSREIRWSDHLLGLLGLDAATRPAVPEEVLERVHPADRELARTTLQRCLERGGDYRAELRLLDPRSGSRWVSVFGKIHRDAAGRPDRIYGVATDVTDTRRLQEQLLQSQKMEGIGRLAGGIAHDFNNLMTAIVGYAEMIRLKSRPGPGPAGALGQIERAANRAADLTRQLLAFARKQVMDPRVFSCDDLLRDAESLLTRLIGEHITLVIRPASAGPGGAAPYVRADAGQIEQVLVNMAVNARDAMPQGGRLTITCGVERDPGGAEAGGGEALTDRVVVTVSDTGVGMTPQVLEHLFEPFFTTKPIGEGTGLGLATCYGILRQAGGRIEVASEPGAGTTFRLLIPRASAPEVPAQAPAARQTALPPGAGHETILIAEDDPLVREVTASALEAQGYRLLLAEHGLDALAVARSHEGTIDLLLTDMVMPHLGGWELAERLTRDRPGIRVLYVSGYADNPAFREGNWGPGRSFLPKPYHPADLARRVREMLDARAASGAARVS